MNRARALGALASVLVVAAVVTAEQASAHMLVPGMCGAKQPAKVELHCGKRAFYHGLGEVRWLRAHPKAADRRDKLADHLWLMRSGARWIAEARVRLAPPPPPAPVVGHWSLWSCITYGAYPGAAHEGNGYNGLYVGWLGMTTPWAGHMPTGGDWVHTPQAVVYADAEQEFAKEGYSITWLEHQWPNTSPPCVAKGLAG
jgi:hypothetical protein